MEVLPQVYCCATRAVNCYLCAADEGLTLIDASTPNQADHIFNFIQRIGYHPRDLRRILVTHTDRDHVGSLAEIQAATGVKVFAGEEAISWLQEGRAPAHLPRPVQGLVDRFLGYEPLPASVVRPVHDGDLLPVLDELQVIASPGHTPDHVAFFSRAKGVLFAGDALSTRGGRVGLPSGAITADVAAARHSAIKLLELAPAVIACGHGKPLHSHTMDDIMSLLQDLK